MRILVVEDERITRASLARRLESWGHAVTAATDGEEAWTYFCASEFDLVITDWEMPVLTGPELIARIRASTQAAYVYIIMLTSRNDKADIVGGIEAGADDYVGKPFDREELRVRVLAGERVVRLERTLSAQNVELRLANERMREDLRAAARVQQAMLPTRRVDSARMRAAWTYVPTDELGGDALGMHLIDERYLVTYVLDVAGHGVPAALLAVTAMHALSPSAEGVSLLRDGEDRSEGDPVQSPAWVLTELNRRFCASDNGGRFLTMVLYTLDIHTGMLCFARAGHPLPLLLRGAGYVALSDFGGIPLGVIDPAVYEDVMVQLAPGDRLVLYSDGFPEQPRALDRERFSESRLRDLLATQHAVSGPDLIACTVDTLAAWAGALRFADDLSMVVIDWMGA